MLGMVANAGRRRSADIQRTRLKTARDRALGRTGITPVIPYGWDVMGAAAGPLLHARRTSMIAAAAPGHGKNIDLSHCVNDGRKGSADPLFDAHGLAVRQTAYSVWQQWLPHPAACKYVSVYLP